jgi:hypothetical protein
MYCYPDHDHIHSPLCLQANDLEQQLWKSCFYRPIEEFRKRMKLAQEAANGAPNAGATPEVAQAQVGSATNDKQGQGQQSLC